MITIIFTFFVISKFVSLPQVFIYNSTASEPIGYYRIINLPKDYRFKKGDYIAFKLPAEAERLSIERGWAKKGHVPLLLKQVGASPGQEYNITNIACYVNGKYIGPIATLDSKNRPMPIIRGTFTVKEGYVLPLSSYKPNSFDGRYFGEIPISSIKYRVVPFFTTDSWIFNVLDIFFN